MNASELLNGITKSRRGQAETIRHVRNQGEDALASKLLHCGTWLHLREWLKHGGETRLLNANFCKAHLLCPCCASRRAVKLIARYTPRAETIQRDRPELIPMMITMGVANGNDLSERTTHLRESWKRMTAAARKGESDLGRHARIEWNKLAGSIRSIEVTNKGNGWHPHAHVFALATDFIDRERLSAEWLRFTGDSYIVDVRKCHGGTIAGMCEVLKYVLKPGELSTAQKWEVYQAMKGTRMVDPQGLLRGVLEGDIDSDDLPDLDGPTRDYLATWIWSEMRYGFQDVPDDPHAISREEEARLSCSIR